MTLRLAALTAFLAPLSLTQPLASQIPLFRTALDPGRNAAFGVDDVDGDSIPDVLVANDSGDIDLRSGVDGSAIRTLYRGAPRLRPQALSDWNGDGTFDVLISERDFGSGGHQIGRLLVISGADGATLREIRGSSGPNGRRIGGHTDTLGDVDGDGVEDLLTTTFATGAIEARAILFSGATGTPLYETAPENFQISSIDPISALAALDDLDGDGIRDFVVGYSDASVTAFGSGAIVLHSGADGSVIERRFGDPTAVGVGLGIDATGLDDQDRDGIDDFLIASRDRAEVLSGATRTVLFALPGNPLGFGAAFNGSVESWAQLDDLDGDGRSELAQTGSPSRASRIPLTIDVFQGGTGRPFRRVILDGLELLDGRFSVAVPIAVSSNRDFDGDGIGDLVTTQIGTANPRLTILSVTAQRTTAVGWRGLGCEGGPAPTIHPRPGATPQGVDAELRGAIPGRTAVLVVGLAQPTPTPNGLLPRLPGTPCAVYLQPESAIAIGIAPIDANGRATLAVPILPIPGLVLGAQWLAEAPGVNAAGFLTSDSLVIRY